MPNWCDNVLVVEDGSGADAFVADLHRKANDNGIVEAFFDAFDPMPRVLRDVQTGTITVDDVQYHAWRTITTPAPESLSTQQVPVPAAELAAWKRLYGADNWYDWAIKHWGTKWDTRVDVDDLPYLRFATAWAPPLAFVETLSTRYPSANFRLVYAEQGTEFAGERLYQGGVVMGFTHYDGPFFLADAHAGDDYDYEYPDSLTPFVRRLVVDYSVGLGG